MTAHTRNNPTDTMMSPSKAANYVAALEAKLGRRVERACILSDGGIDVQMATDGTPTDPAALVDMSE